MVDNWKKDLSSLEIELLICAVDCKSTSYLPFMPVYLKPNQTKAGSCVRRCEQVEGH